MDKKKGLALMIVGNQKPKEGPGDSYEALLAACGGFLGAIGLEVDAEREAAACEALRDFVHIAMDSDEN